MRTQRTAATLALLLVALTGAAVAWRQAGSSDSEHGIPEVPVNLSPALDVLVARPFVVDEPFPHYWRAETPAVDAGYLLVLEVDPAYVFPRESREPVLYVGAETAERVNRGYPSGRLVAIVPAPRAEDGTPALDLASTPIWFGPPALPERIDAARAARELETARAAGLAPLPLARVDSARDTGGPLTRFPDRTALERHAAELILEHAPDETELARGILAPLVR